MEEASSIKGNSMWYKLLGLAEKRGIVVFVTDDERMTKHLNGLWFRLKGDMEFIILSSGLKQRKRNFVLGHELGHAVLHRNTTFNFLEKGGKSDKKMEVEADRYAERLIRWLNRKGGVL